MTISNNKPTSTFWIIGIAALIWNLMGVAAYLGQAYMTNEVLKALPDAEQLYYTNIPAWVTVVFAISVFAGFLGCVALLLRKSWAKILFIVSLLAVLSQFTYNFFIQDYMEVTIEKAFMPIIVIGLAVFLIWYSQKSQDKGWI